MKSRFLVFQLLFLLSDFLIQKIEAALTCQQRGLCICHMSDGSGLIDLSSVGSKQGYPRFENISGTNPDDKNLYSFNPCYGFTLGSLHDSCRDVSACVFNSSTNEFINIGNKSSANFQYDEKSKEFMLVFSSVIKSKYSNTKGRIAFTHVHLQCSSHDYLEVYGVEDNKHLSFNMTLFSHCACLDGCARRLSTGSILLITFTFLILTYFLVGVLYNKAVYNATGTDLIPNYTFWYELPGLVRDGYLFFISPCIADNPENQYYESL